MEPDPVRVLAMENLGTTSGLDSGQLCHEEFLRLAETVTDLSIHHGDLWGNVWFTEEGEVVLSDPKGYVDDPAELRWWRKK